MTAVKNYIIVLALHLLAIHLPAQNITGTWEGDLGTYQFLQLNIIQNGDKICGYTRDHVKGDQRSFCKAYFEGSYDKKKRKLTLTGKSFIERKEGHVLMQLSLTYRKVNGWEVLEYRRSVISVFSDFWSDFRSPFADPFGQNDPFARDERSEDYVYLRKVSTRPYEIQDKMRDCLELEKLHADTTAKVTAPENPEDSLPTGPEAKEPEKSIDSLSTGPEAKELEKRVDSLPIVTIPIIKNTDSISIPKKAEQRKNIEQSYIEVNVKTINLKVYDNAIVDGDTVSILYNGKMLLSHQLLSEKAIEINIELDDGQTRHEIILFAENLGSIVPNTALVVITAGEKRYELFASASLQENAVLVFDYRPR